MSAAEDDSQVLDAQIHSHWRQAIAAILRAALKTLTLLAARWSRRSRQQRLSYGKDVFLMQGLQQARLFVGLRCPYGRWKLGHHQIALPVGLASELKVHIVDAAAIAERFGRAQEPIVGEMSVELVHRLAGIAVKIGRASCRERV